MTQNANAQIETKPVPGSPEYDAAMIAIAERGGVQVRVPTDPENKSQTTVIDLSQTPEQKAAADAAAATAAAAAKPQRPANVPEKFWNAETGTVNTDALLKSYTELEKRPAAKPAVEVKPAAPVKTDAQKAAETKLAAATDDAAKAAAQTELTAANTAAEAAAKAAADAAVKPGMQEAVAAASAEFAEKGEMSDATYAALEAQGLSRDYVDAYVDGIKARAEVVTAKVYDAAGGQENYAAIQAWASANLSAEEIAAANAAIHSGNFDAVIGQVKSLKTAYEAANGTEGSRRIEGNRGSSVTPYRTKSEVTTAMNDPRYKADATYRREVEQKVEAAMKANIDLGF